MKTNDELEKEIKARDILLERMTEQLCKALERMAFWQQRAMDLEFEFSQPEDYEQGEGGY